MWMAERWARKMAVLWVVLKVAKTVEMKDELLAAWKVVMKVVKWADMSAE